MPPERTNRSLSGTPCNVTTGAFSRAINGCDCYNECRGFVANSPTMPIRIAQPADLPSIVAVYNAAIPGRMATADTTPVTVAQRAAWFAEFDENARPLWVCCDAEDASVQGWLSVRSFYGRPAYHATVEVGVYVAPSAQRQRHRARDCWRMRSRTRRHWESGRCSHSCSATTRRRSRSSKSRVLRMGKATRRRGAGRRRARSRDPRTACRMSAGDRAAHEGTPANTARSPSALRRRATCRSSHADDPRIGGLRAPRASGRRGRFRPRRRCSASVPSPKR